MTSWHGDAIAGDPEPIVLQAVDLWARYGFCDGDILSDYGWEIEPDREHRVLISLVRKYLVPEIEKLGITTGLCEVDTIHNPIRAEQWHDAPPDLIRSIRVEVTVAQIQAVLDELGYGE